MKSSSSSRSPNIGAKQTTKNIIKKFGPFLVTGLAAVAEHHLLKHDDKRDEEPKAPASEPDRDDDSSIRRLKRDVRDLKKELKRQGKKAVEVVLESSSSSDDESSLEVVFGEEMLRNGRKMHERGKFYARSGGEPVRGFEQREMEIPEIRVFPPPPPRVPSPPLPPPGVPSYVPIYEPPCMQQPDPIPGPHRSHKFHERETHITPRLLKDEVVLNATEVAAIAGIMEGLHLADSKGNWWGPKGMRVGTAMATAAGTSYVRGRRGEDTRPVDMVVDVGAGLIATRVIYGSKRRLLKESRSEHEGEKKRKRSNWF
jgi:hypothetical protein